jgi:ABC-type transporter Mla subunit MlaD
MSNVEATSAKMPALVDDFKKTVKDADEAVTKIDAMLGENRPDIRASIAELRKALESASQLVDQMGRTINYNSENIDETLENIRITTENLKQFTDTIKSRPYTLIRATSAPERKPGEPPKQ